jgi:spermidine synthase
MRQLFEELAYVSTPIGGLSLRRRKWFARDADIYEIKLGDDFLMSSICTASEAALARLGLAELSKESLDVVVGGLGLGYTAKAVLEDDRVRSLWVIETIPEVIEWHEKGLLPLEPSLSADSRCKLVQGNFFAMASAAGFDPCEPDRRFDAILVDIDHSPRQLLHPSHASLYDESGLRDLAERLNPGGAFGLWSNDRPDQQFCQNLDKVFAVSRAQIFTFPNPLKDSDEAATIYIARKS